MYFRARHYSARLGRFTQTDPLARNRPFEHYAYAFNNPPIVVDPLGTDGWGPSWAWSQGTTLGAQSTLYGKQQKRYATPAEIERLRLAKLDMDQKLAKWDLAAQDPFLQYVVKDIYSQQLVFFGTAVRRDVYAYLQRLENALRLGKSIDEASTEALGSVGAEKLPIAGPAERLASQNRINDRANRTVELTLGENVESGVQLTVDVALVVVPFAMEARATRPGIPMAELAPRGAGIPLPAAPRPPGWTSAWEWRYPEGTGKSTPRWFDPVGAEWRWHPADKWHPQGHWDYNPWTEWNSPWRNVPQPPAATLSNPPGGP